MWPTSRRVFSPFYRDCKMADEAQQATTNSALPFGSEAKQGISQFYGARTATAHTSPNQLVLTNHKLERRAPIGRTSQITTYLHIEKTTTDMMAALIRHGLFKISHRFSSSQNVNIIIFLFFPLFIYSNILTDNHLAIKHPCNNLQNHDLSRTVITSPVFDQFTSNAVFSQVARQYATKNKKPHPDKKKTPKIDSEADALAEKGCVHTSQATDKLILAAIVVLQSRWWCGATGRTHGQYIRCCAVIAIKYKNQHSITHRHRELRRDFWIFRITLPHCFVYFVNIKYTSLLLNT